MHYVLLTFVPNWGPQFPSVIIIRFYLPSDTFLTRVQRNIQDNLSQLIPELCLKKKGKSLLVFLNAKNSELERGKYSPELLER